MEESKLKEFLRGIGEKTRQRRIPWEPTATDELAAAIGGEFTVTVFPYKSGYETHYALVLHDAQNRELIRVDTESGYGWLGSDLENLYQTARHQGLRVDEKLGKLLGALERL
jgi:hypothetical protein